MTDTRPGAVPTLVVTPTQRLAHWLRRRHDEDCLARGLDVWPTLDAVGWSGFVERCFHASRDAGMLGQRWIPDAAARVAWDRIVRGDAASAGVVAPGALARSAWQAWQSLHEWEIPLAAVSRDDRPESLAWYRWASEYLAFLDTHRGIDAALAQAKLGDVAPAGRIEFVGFERTTPAQRSLIGRLEKGGCEVVERVPVGRAGATVRVDCRDRAEELERAARWAAGRLDRDPVARLAIVVPDLASDREAVRRALEPVLVPAATRAGGPAPGTQFYELAAAGTLDAQPIVIAAIEAIEAALGDGNLARASRLLRSAFVGGGADERSARAMLDAWIRRREEPDLDLGRLASLASARGAPGLGAALEAALEIRDRWPRRALPSRWAQFWAEFLRTLGWPGDGLASEEYQALERWRRLLGDLGAGDDAAGVLSGASALAMLRDEAGAVLFEPQSPPARLLVADAANCAGMDFDGLWIVGLDSTHWPPPASPDPFLPREWQLRREMPRASAAIAAAEAARLYAQLRASADAVVVSVPALDGEATLLPSALVLDLDTAEPDGAWTRDVPAVALHAGRPVLERLEDGSLPAGTGGHAARGGSQLVALTSACPFRAQAELRLGARVLEEPALGIAATERGELVHAVLARLWREFGDRASLAALAPKERASRVHVAVAEESAAAIASARGVMRRLLEIEVSWLEARVLELIEHDLARPPFSVQAVEEPLTLAIGGLSLSLRVDRIDRLEDGTLAVIDYKTGGDAEPSAWLGERPRLPQLPLYAEAVGTAAVGAIAFGRVRAGDTGFRGYARNPQQFPGLAGPGARQGWPREFASWGDLLAGWHRRLETIAREFAVGDARLAHDPKTACEYCHLAALCRIHQSDEPGAVDD
ncbi:MAG: PD-(D/E)XK nuclease family protein [Steroidobacteraceae bacterium]